MTSRHKPRLRALAVAGVLLGLVPGPARLQGIFVGVESRLVPVDRLVQNLERELAANPKNAEVHINLARLHGMAYALKVEEVPAGGYRPEDKDKPYFGPQPKLIPYQTR
ncbi:MAG TPA: hypothetical protein VIC04_03875, partial [Terriglobia bacterium]